MTNQLRLAVIASAALFLAAPSGMRASGPADVSSAIAADHRLGPLVTLDGDFPFTPPASAEDWEARARDVRRRVQVSMGLWPMPETTPLNAVVHGRIARDGYTVDRVYFESLPGHFVSGSLYRPVGRSGRLPGVLLPHGHWDDGRFNAASESELRQSIVAGAERFDPSGRSPLQAGAVQLARMGAVAFLYDMEGYADSVQIPNDVAHSAGHGRPKRSPAAPGLFFSADAELRLESIMGLQAWNARRALDFLISLPDVDPARVAVSGASGGGTQTFILGALDSRPATLFPMVMVGTRMQGGCTCENADYLRIGTGNVEIAGLAAPRPLGMTTADDWTKTMPETGFPGLQTLYALLGVAADVAIFPFPQFPHNYNYVSRSAMYAWMNRRLGLGLPEPVVQDDFVPLTREEASVWDASHPRPASGDAEERRVTSWWTRSSEAQMASLMPHDAASLDRFRDVVGGALAVMIGREAPGPADVQARAGESTRRGSTAIRHGLLMRSRWQEVTPFVELTPAQPSGATIVWLDEHGAKGLLNADGAPTAAVDAALSRGARVIGIDVFGTGAFLEHGGRNANRLLDGPPFAPYTFGYNSPLIIQRVADVLAALRFARGGTGAGVEPLSVAPQSPGEARDAPPSEPRPTAAERVYLVGFGRDAGAWALLARAAAPTLVDRVAVDTGGFRFASVSSLQDAAFLPGSVKYGDLPGFTALGAPGPLWLAGEGSAAPALVEAAYRAAGAPRALTVAGPKGDPGAAVEWLLRPR